MKVPFFSLTRQYRDIKDEVDDAVERVLSEGSFILGENVHEFEREFARYCGAKYAVGLASGSDAITLTLAVLNIEGSTVATVSHTFVSTVDAIVRNNAIPKFVDVEGSSYTLNPSLLSGVIDESTTGILPVHLYGHPVDMNPIKEIAQKNGLWIVEDACQAHGSEYNKQRIGVLGDATCFSFYPSKTLGAYGDAGMVVTGDSGLADKLKTLRNYGQIRKNQYARLGFNSRLDEIQAAILRVKLRHLDDWIKRRRKLAKLYSEELGNLEGISVPIERDYAGHSYHLYVIRSKRRDELRDWLSSKGVNTGIHYPTPVHLQGSYSHLNNKVGSLPVTERIVNEVLSLPLFPELNEEEVLYVTNLIKNFHF